MQQDSRAVPEHSLDATPTPTQAAISTPFKSSPPAAASRSAAASWPRLVGISLVVLLFVVAGTAYGTYAMWRNSGQLAAGLIIQGEPVGGLTQQQASARLQKRFGRLFLEVQTPQRPYKMSLRELGGTPQITRVTQNAYWYGRSGNVISNVVRMWTTRGAEHRVALPVTWNKSQLRRKMSIVARNYQVAPRDAALQVAGGQVQVIPEVEGRTINLGDTLQKLQRGYYLGLPATTATVRALKPRLTAADLEGSDVKMAEYTTRFNPGERGRTTNVRIAARAIDGRVLMPGELYSFNASTGERTSRKGYRTAHIFVRKPGASESEIVDGLGGGVCQVSSTLFNAVRKANQKKGRRLKIVERNSHSLPVVYVPSGLDATVAWPYKDFKFRNKFSHPVYLRSAVRGSRLSISVWGRVPHSLDNNALPADAVNTPERHAETF